MSRKVFISFLGTSNYIETHYELNGEKSAPVRFIQEALVGFLCKDWSDTDKVLIFCTNKAKELNWVDNGQPRPESDIEKIGLKHRLEENFPFLTVECCDIEEGFSEAEIWKIFSNVYDKIEDDDEIHFDVTHAFRSIPMFSTVLFNYARFMKKTTLASVHYGAFEKIGTSMEVRKMNREDRVAPIIDLTNIVRLQEYTEMASSLSTYGRVKSMGQWSVDKRKSDKYKLPPAIKKFDSYILTNRMNDVKSGNFMTEIKNQQTQMYNQGYPEPICDVVQTFYNKLHEHGFVEGDSNKNIEAAIQWDLDYDMLSQAYTMGEEYVISRLVEIFESKDPYDNTPNGNKKFRTFLSAICAVSKEIIKNGEYKGLLAENRELADALMKEPLIKKFRKSYQKLSGNRNKLSHARNDIGYAILKDQFLDSFNACLEILNNADANKPL